MPVYRETALVFAEQFSLKDNKIPKGVTEIEIDHKMPGRFSTVVYVLNTLEGQYMLRDGDYICTGPKGEQWNVEKSIFEATYEEVKD